MLICFIFALATYCEGHEVGEYLALYIHLAAQQPIQELIDVASAANRQHYLMLQSWHECSFIVKGLVTHI